MNNKRSCRKCGEYIPYKIKIDGKEKHLGNRKFCLKCSPYKSHNTKPDDPNRPSIKKQPYSCWSEEAKKRGKENIYRRGWSRKQKLVELAGGFCKKCGYNKNIKVLTFHHRNPDDKEFGLTINNLWSRKWEVILEEFYKCDMYCQNCHMEIEDELNMSNPNYYRNLFSF